MNRFLLTICGATLLLSQSFASSALAGATPAPDQPPAIAQPPRPCGPPPTPAGFWRNPQLADKLALSQEQVKSLRDIDYGFLTKAIKLRAELDQLQLAHEKLAAEKKDAEAQAAIEKLAQLHAELFRLHAEAKTAAAKALKPEQMAVLESSPDPMAPPKGCQP